MKTMTCKQLGGICDMDFSANSFEEIESMVKQHALEMFRKEDKDHLEAMEKMKGLMQDPAVMKEWMENKKKEYEALPDDK